MIDIFAGKYNFLSNFYLCPVVFDDVTYPSSEHAFQAAKTLIAAERRHILKTKRPSDAKRLSYTVTLRPEWDKIRIPMMERVLLSKFNGNTELRDLLVATSGQELVEGNDWGDRFWGKCNGEGKNELGKALMRVRKTLIATSKQK